MADTHETIADIIAEMRRICIREFQDYADRLEAAHKRERGDAAKLREAVGYILKYADSIACRDHDEHTRHYIDQIRKWAQSALSAPPRNCDRFATVDEARKAHEAICEKYGKCHNGCPLNNEEHYSAFDCFEAWLFAQAEGGAE